MSTRKTPHTGPGHAAGDPGWCEGCAAEVEAAARETQEPSDAEVQAAVTAILALTGESEETARMDDIDQAWDHARAALTATRSPEGA